MDDNNVFTVQESNILFRGNLSDNEDSMTD